MRTDKIIDALHTKFFEHLIDLLDTRFGHEKILEIEDKITFLKGCKISCEHLLEDLYEKKGEIK